MVRATKEELWGIVVYHGNLDEPALFDGWYSIEALAHEVFGYWQSQYPNCTVALVKQVETRFSAPVQQVEKRLRTLTDDPN